MRQRKLTAVAIGLALALAGCGGGNGGGEATPETPGARESTVGPAAANDDARAINDLHERYFTALLGLDGEEACSYLSDAGQAQVIDDAREQGAFSGDTCPELAAQVGALLRGFVGEDPDVSLRDLEVTGDSATALSIVGPQRPDSVVSAEPDPVAFERVNGEWLIGPEPDEGADGARSGGVTPGTADGWAASWCDLRVGMTRAEVRRVMGEPTSTHSGESSQDSWSAYQWSFTVFYRFRTDIPDPADEPAYQLQASDISLTPADRRRISCPLTRS